MKCFKVRLLSRRNRDLFRKFYVIDLRGCINSKVLLALIMYYKKITGNVETQQKIWIFTRFSHPEFLQLPNVSKVHSTTKCGTSGASRRKAVFNWKLMNKKIARIQLSLVSLKEFSTVLASMTLLFRRFSSRLITQIAIENGIKFHPFTFTDVIVVFASLEFQISRLCTSSNNPIASLIKQQNIFKI